MKRKIIIVAIAALSMLNISVFGMTTQEFDEGMKKGIDYFNQGLYYEAKDEFTWFRDYNYDRMNPGQQKYLDEYLYGAKWNAEQWENSSASSKYKLKEYAKNHIWSIYNDDVNTAYANIKFLVADLTGDGAEDLLAVAFDGDNSPVQLEVYTVQNGNVVRIINDHWGAYNGGRLFASVYKGQTYLVGESFSSGTGFLLNLIQYNGAEWYTAHSCHAVYDWAANTWVGYNIDGNMVSEWEYYQFREDIYSNELAVHDFADRDAL